MSVAVTEERYKRTMSLLSGINHRRGGGGRVSFWAVLCCSFPMAPTTCRLRLGLPQPFSSTLSAARNGTCGFHLFTVSKPQQLLFNFGG